MKKTLLFLFVIFFFFESNAQLTGGIKGGLNIAQIRSEVSGDTESTDMLVGFQFGGYMNYPLSDKVAIQPEFVFTRVGGKDSEYDPDLQTDIDVAAVSDYLSVPIMFVFNAGENFRFLIGPQVGFLVGAEFQLEALGQSIDVDAKDAYNKIDFGLTGGIGYAINKVTIDARYNFGLANIVKDSGDDSAQNRVIALTVSYRLFER